jgi:hypothetical protein
MRGSPFGKWVIGHRFQAHLAIPGLVSIILIVLYFFGNLSLQSLIAPGFSELPLSGGNRINIPGIIKAWCLFWILLLCVRTIGVTVDIEVRVVAIAILVGITIALLSWIDGNALVSRVWTGLVEPENQVEGILSFVSSGWFTPAFIVISVLSILFFVIVPLLNAGTQNPVTSILTPSRWMIWTVILMLVVFKLAHTLQGKGWGMVNGVEGTLAGDVSVFMALVFQYMVVLYMAELNYRSVVRKNVPKHDWRY